MLRVFDVEVWVFTRAKILIEGLGVSSFKYFMVLSTNHEIWN